MMPGVGSGVVRAITDGWQIGTVLQARSGSPADAEHDGQSLAHRPRQPASDASSATRISTIAPIERWFNTAAFAPNTPGVWGDTPRGFLRGPAYWNIDLALSRVLRMPNEHRVEVRARSVQPDQPRAPRQPEYDARQRRLRAHHRHRALTRA